MNKDTLITGGSGMLGGSLSLLFPEAEILHGKRERDLSSLEDAENWISTRKYKTIIHAAALTDLNTRPEKFEEIMNLHSNIVPILSKKCEHFIYISTVPVWQKGSTTLKDYYVSKRFGEEETLRAPNGTVLRTNIFGNSNLIDWAHRSLICGERINGFTNSYFNPVHTLQLSEIIKELSDIGTSSKRILTIGGDAILSKYDFLIKVANRLSLDTNLITPHEREESEDLTLTNPDIIFPLDRGLEILSEQYNNK